MDHLISLGLILSSVVMTNEVKIREREKAPFSLFLICWNNGFSEQKRRLECEYGAYEWLANELNEQRIEKNQSLKKTKEDGEKHGKRFILCSWKRSKFKAHTIPMSVKHRTQRTNEAFFIQLAAKQYKAERRTRPALS